MSWLGSNALGERKNVKQVIPRKPVRKYAKRGKAHKHRCPVDRFLWVCYVADCKLSDSYPCIDCAGHFIINKGGNNP